MGGFFLWHNHINVRGSRRASSGIDLAPVVVYGLIAIACLAGLGALLLMGLWTYHLFLISQGKTTKEHLKGRKPIKGLHDEPTIFAPRGPQLFNQFALVTSLNQNPTCTEP